ncbi:MAG: diguanylate cyclase, partial [Clostridia bacterium]|nr:diguanylate cyclase [Clostridia bacterium]
MENIILVIAFASLVTAIIHIIVDKALSFNKKELKNILKQKIICEERFKLAVEGSNDGIWEWDHENKHFYCSSQWKKMLGYNENMSVDVKFIFRILHLSDSKMVSKKLKYIMAGKSDFLNANVRLKCRDGKYKWILCRGKVLRNDKGNMIRIAGSHSDIDEVVHLTKEVKYEKEFLNAILETAPNIILVIDKDGKIISMSKYARCFFEFNTSEFKLDEIFLKYEQDKILNYMEHIDQYPEGLVCKVATKTGSIRSVLWQLSHVRDTNNSRRTLFIGTDITESEKSKKTIQELEYYDQLTQLPNRQSFMTKLNKMIQQGQIRLAVLYIDLDNFKNINDVFGHDFGDRYLINIGQIIQDSIEGLDGYVARLGGDEFAIVLKNATKKNAAELSLKIKRKLKEQILVEDILMDTTASIGIAFFPQDAKNEQELLICVDAAMYRAKLMGKNTVQFFNQEIYEEILEKNILINQLKHALNNDKFILYYQPIYNTISDGISVVETLIRWDKNGEIIPPDRFIPISEETGLIVPIGYWILKKAFEQSKEWKNKGINVLFSINISWVQLKQKNFTERVKYLMDEIGVDPKMIIFEITEEIMFK